MATHNGSNRGGQKACGQSSSQALASSGDPSAEDVPSFALASLGDLFRRDIGLRRASNQTRALYVTLKALDNQ